MPQPMEKAEAVIAKIAEDVTYDPANRTEEYLLNYCRETMPERELGGLLPGYVVVFRIVAGQNADQFGVMLDDDHFLIDYPGRGLTVMRMNGWWKQRAAAAFAVPSSFTAPVAIAAE